MKRILLITLLLSSAFLVKAQPADTTKRVFTIVEAEPSFFGGMDRFYLYLQANIKYPADAIKNKLQGKVFVGFVVEKDGSLTDIKILRGVSPSIDAEAIRVISNSPRWKPGIENGRPVNVQYNMALNFKLPPPEVIKAQLLADSLENVPFDKKIFTAVEQEPQFPGGLEKLYNYLQTNLKYPENARDQGIRGRVRINFVVEKDGSLSNFEIRKSLSPETDAEALRVMQNCPKWQPGMQNGQAVRVEYSVPIPFPVDEQ
jgi:TonB family protein